ncbi:hypothetical protein RBG61_03915 [Paludicola sp. MB14-C6]|uniref:hypothetical protein n=1 Tax=Paludihabitans sp. MB14-C6 TaxID=3070656 RepID=UPI0027DB51ED|nr:hypothetical protein [Paludicola sp. MB14-C6]WMJ23822.1 hypothetical protein RBG61_03915 [Paludicola sp. MB14-C6]
MSDKLATPLLLLDNSNMITVINQGEFKCTNLSFEEAKAIMELHTQDEVLRCFTNNTIETIIFEYLGIAKQNYQYKNIRNMRVGQDAIVFKLYTTPSETKPIIKTIEGIEAKKIQNVYVYCQFISRLK